jgi:hypothetical protein
MSQGTQKQVVDILAKGLENYVKATADQSYLKMAPIVLRDVRDVFFENIYPNDSCLFTMPSMIVRPEIRVDCFVAILTNRVIVAWRKGIFKKTTEYRIIPKNTIKQASWAVSDRPGSRGAWLLTIVADETTNIALPLGKPNTANAITAAVMLNTDADYAY